MSEENQLTPPVTKNQSLPEILNEIESRANKATVSHRYEDHRESFLDVPKLVGIARDQDAALAKVADYFRVTVRSLRTMGDYAWAGSMDKFAKRVLSEHYNAAVEALGYSKESSSAAILTSPENGEQQSRSLGELRAV